jgi:hypothetical protein
MDKDEYMQHVRGLIDENIRTAMDVYDISTAEIDQAVAAWSDELSNIGLDIQSMRDVELMCVVYTIIWHSTNEMLSLENCHDSEHVLGHLARGLVRISCLLQSKWDRFSAPTV